MVPLGTNDPMPLPGDQVEHPVKAWRLLVGVDTPKHTNQWSPRAADWKAGRRTIYLLDQFWDAYGTVLRQRARNKLVHGLSDDSGTDKKQSIDGTDAWLHLAESINDLIAQDLQVPPMEQDIAQTVHQSGMIDY
jgi:hypothetical protein